MGDSGSQTIGLIVGLLSVRFCMYDGGSIGNIPYNPLVIVFLCSWYLVLMSSG